MRAYGYSSLMMAVKARPTGWGPRSHPPSSAAIGAARSSSALALRMSFSDQRGGRAPGAEHARGRRTAGACWCSGELILLLLRLVPTAMATVAPPPNTIQHVAYTDAGCTENPRVLKSLTLNACQHAYATSTQQLSFVCVTPDCPAGLGPTSAPGQKPANGTLVITGVQNATSCDGGCAGGCSQFSNAFPGRCDSFASGGGVTLYSSWKVEAACVPDCSLCQGLYDLAQCDYVPSTVPPTSLTAALPGCVGCASALSDNAGCNCEPCWDLPSSAPPDTAPPPPPCNKGKYCPPPPVPESPPGCIGGMCTGTLGVPCMDCGVLSGGNTTACRECMRNYVKAEGGVCDFMLKTVCDPDSCA